ncbi:hypothetical protein OIV83_002434 [Microbotryomycetes sp. JL201]|nr:hypothetical protein OIV83_002434 [Microbotryomycetes sp. JL201]
MAQPPTRGNRDEDVLSFLNSLDTYSSPPPQPQQQHHHHQQPQQLRQAPSAASRPPASSTGSSRTKSAALAASGAASGAPKTADEAQSVLDFLDEITQRSATPTAPVKPSGDLRRKTSVPGGLAKSTSNRSLAGASTAATTSAQPGGTAAANTVQHAPQTPGASAPRRSTDSVRSQRSVTGTGPTHLPTSPRASGPPPKTATPAVNSKFASPSPSNNDATVAVSSFAAKPGPPPATHFHEPVIEKDEEAESSPKQAFQTQPVAQHPAPSSGGGGGGTGGGWGWSSVWSQASNVISQASNVVQQARTVAEEQVKTASKVIGESEQAKKWSEGVREYAKNAHLDQLGENLKSTTMKGLTDLLNAVAPPIAEHEVIEVTLSHDMVGYEGVETLVYRGLAKVMEAVEGGTLVLNQKDDRPRKSTSDDDERNLNVINGLQEGWKGAEVKLDELVKSSFQPQTKSKDDNGMTVPVHTCPVYMRIQPCLANLPFLPPSLTTASQGEGPKASQVLFFLLLLRDPTHNLVHSSLSQSMPAAWLDIPFEENEWVEDAMVEIIRRSVEIIGSEYIQHRMRAQANAISKVREEAQRTLKEQAPASAAAQPPPPPPLSAEEQRQRDEDSQAAMASARAQV